MEPNEKKAQKPAGIRAPNPSGPILAEISPAGDDWRQLRRTAVLWTGGLLISIAITLWVLLK
jgi:hypothetical protein